MWSNKDTLRTLRKMQKFQFCIDIVSQNSVELPHDVNYKKVLNYIKTVWQTPTSPKSIINALISPEILEYMLINRFTYLLVVLRIDLFLQLNNLVLSCSFSCYRNKKFCFTLLSIVLHCTCF